MKRHGGFNDHFLYQPVPTASSWNDDSVISQAPTASSWNDDSAGSQQSDFSFRRELTAKSTVSSNIAYNVTQNVLMIVLGMAMGFLLGYDRNITTEHIHQQTASPLNNASNSLLGTTDFRTEMSALELLGELTRTRRAVFQKFVQEYGPYANLLAMDQDVLNHLFVISDESRKRFQRRIIKKIVTKKLYALNVEKSIIAPSDRFTWVTAGDTVAGGFGNRPEETYTAILEETVRPVFAAVGIDFYALNQAKIGYGSAPELALCMNTVFHTKEPNDEVDVLSWDFSRTDGERIDRSILWAAKATMNPFKPLLMMMAPLKSLSWNEFSTFERRGMGVALMNFDVLRATQGLLPDSVREGANPQDLPLPLRYFLCNGATEGSIPCDDAQHNFACPVDGGEQCRAQKFTKLDFCYQYGRYQANWVPGWKDHHIRGRLLGIFWINILQGSLLQLDELLDAQESSNEEERYHKVLQNIEDQERLDSFLLRNHPPPQFSQYDEINRDFEIISPALNRTECFLITSATPVTSKGLTGESLLSTVDTIQEDKCEVVKWGYRESLQVTAAGGEGETPTETTLEIRSSQQFESFVRIAVCFQICILNEAGECTMDEVKLESDQVKLKVDGVEVTGLREMDSCYFLEGSNNGFHWELTSLSSYHLQIQVNKGSVMSIFSVITMQ